jgi:hypothetical protein
MRGTKCRLILVKWTETDVGASVGGAEGVFLGGEKTHPLRLSSKTPFVFVPHATCLSPINRGCHVLSLNVPNAAQK